MAEKQITLTTEDMRNINLLYGTLSATTSNLTLSSPQEQIAIAVKGIQNYFNFVQTGVFDEQTKKALIKEFSKLGMRLNKTKGLKGPVLPVPAAPLPIPFSMRKVEEINYLNALVNAKQLDKQTLQVFVNAHLLEKKGSTFEGYYYQLTKEGERLLKKEAPGEAGEEIIRCLNRNLKEKERYEKDVKVAEGYSLTPLKLLQGIAENRIKEIAEAKKKEEGGKKEKQAPQSNLATGGGPSELQKNLFLNQQVQQRFDLRQRLSNVTLPLPPNGEQKQEPQKLFSVADSKIDHSKTDLSALSLLERRRIYAQLFAEFLNGVGTAAGLGEPAANFGRYIEGRTDMPPKSKEEAADFARYLILFSDGPKTAAEEFSKSPQEMKAHYLSMELCTVANILGRYQDGRAFGAYLTAQDGAQLDADTANRVRDYVNAFGGYESTELKGFYQSAYTKLSEALIQQAPSAGKPDIKQYITNDKHISAENIAYYNGLDANGQKQLIKEAELDYIEHLAPVSKEKREEVLKALKGYYASKGETAPIGRSQDVLINNKQNAYMQYGLNQFLEKKRTSPVAATVQITAKTPYELVENDLQMSRATGLLDARNLLQEVLNGKRSKVELQYGAKGGKGQADLETLGKLSQYGLSATGRTEGGSFYLTLTNTRGKGVKLEIPQEEQKAKAQVQEEKKVGIQSSRTQSVSILPITGTPEKFSETPYNQFFGGAVEVNLSDCEYSEYYKNRATLLVPGGYLLEKPKESDMEKATVSNPAEYFTANARYYFQWEIFALNKHYDAEKEEFSDAAKYEDSIAYQYRDALSKKSMLTINGKEYEISNTVLFLEYMMRGLQESACRELASVQEKGGNFGEKGYIDVYKTKGDYYNSNGDKIGEFGKRNNLFGGKTKAEELTNVYVKVTDPLTGVEKLIVNQYRNRNNNGLYKTRDKFVNPVMEQYFKYENIGLDEAIKDAAKGQMTDKEIAAAAKNKNMTSEAFLQEKQTQISAGLENAAGVPKLLLLAYYTVGVTAGGNEYAGTDGQHTQALKDIRNICKNEDIAKKVIDIFGDVLYGGYDRRKFIKGEYGGNITAELKKAGLTQEQIDDPKTTTDLMDKLWYLSYMSRVAPALAMPKQEALETLVLNMDALDRVKIDEPNVKAVLAPSITENTTLTYSLSFSEAKDGEYRTVERKQNIPAALGTDGKALIDIPTDRLGFIKIEATARNESTENKEAKQERIIEIYTEYTAQLQFKRDDVAPQGGFLKYGVKEYGKEAFGTAEYFKNSLGLAVQTDSRGQYSFLQEGTQSNYIAFCKDGKERYLLDKDGSKMGVLKNGEIYKTDSDGKIKYTPTYFSEGDLNYHIDAEGKLSCKREGEWKRDKKKEEAVSGNYTMSIGTYTEAGGKLTGIQASPDIMQLAQGTATAGRQKSEIDKAQEIMVWGQTINEKFESGIRVKGNYGGVHYEILFCE